MKTELGLSHDADLVLVVSKAIQELRVAAHYKGYRYLRFAILLAIEDQTITDEMTKRLYVAVAEEFDATVPQIERAIRNAIEKAWEQSDPNVTKKYFGYYDPMEYPCNKRFVATVADYLRLRFN